MLAESALRLGLKPRVLAGNSSDPAAQLCPDSIFGSWNDPVVLRRFLSQVSVVAFENEFIPCDLLQEAADGLSVRFFPRIEILFQLQDKIRQKDILEKLKIPTAPHEVFSEKEGLRSWCQRQMGKYPEGTVLKWAQLGYDGKGTWISSETRQLESAVEFCQEAVRRKVPLYSEQKVAFRRELSVVACRSTTGEFKAYPLVISVQSGGVCRLVTGPAVRLGVSPQLEKQAHQHARTLAENLDLHGTFAIEFFEMLDGSLWVNEIAPRVHNTGHFTQDGSATSQFENHWRAGLGLSLGDVDCAPGFAMLNLLGPNVEAKSAELPRVTARTHLHWYGKSELRAGRKLGHINGRVDTAEEVPSLVREIEACEKAWIERMDKT